MRQFTAKDPHCVKCKEMKCGACGNISPASSFTERNRVSHNDDGTTLVCATCIGLGCTPRCPTKVECAECKQELGIQRFLLVDWNNYNKLLDNGKRHTSCITCTSCQAKWKARLQDLNTCISRSGIRCTCKKPVHQEVCRIFNPSGAPEKPWQAHGVTAEDIKFLNKQKPSWWLKCLGKN